MGLLDSVRNKLHEANESRKQKAAEQNEINKQYESRLALARQRERLKSADTIAKIEAQQHIQRIKTRQPSGSGGIGSKVLNELKRPVTKEEMNRWSLGGGSSMGLGLSPLRSSKRSKSKQPKKADYSSWMP